MISYTYKKLRLSIEAWKTMNAKLPEHLIERLSALTAADQCLIHRYLYYVLSAPLLSDRDYDMLERAATNDPETPVDHAIHTPGSDLQSSYTGYIEDLALQIHHKQLH